MSRSLLVCVLFALVLGSSGVARAQDDAAKAEAVAIASACADIWATKTLSELNNVGAAALSPFEKALWDLQLKLDDAQGEYGIANLEYIVAHKKATAALEKLASSAADMAIHEALKKQEATPTEPGLLDTLIDKVAKADGQGLTDLALVGVNDAAPDALLQEQAKAEKALIEAKKKALAAEAKVNAARFAITSIRACVNDQVTHLETETADVTPDPSLPAVGEYRMDAVFEGAPTRTFDIPAASGDIPYSPAPCHDACMAAPGTCVAWNYTYNATASGLPPAQCAIYEDGASLGATISKSGFSGFGPKAAGLGLASQAQ